MRSAFARQKPAKGIAAVVMLGISLAVVGAAIGFVTFALTPVKEVRQLPKEEDIDARAVYYIKGNVSGGSTWKQKQDQLLSKQPLNTALIEAELNQWSSSTFRFKEAYQKMEEQPSVKLESPQFRIHEGTLQIATKVTLTSSKKEFIVIVKGTFTSGSKRFNVTEMTIGSAPLPAPIANAVFSTLVGKFTQGESMKDLTNAWASLDKVELSGTNLTLTRK